MKRYSTEHDDVPFEFDTGEYVLYEEAHQVELECAVLRGEIAARANDWLLLSERFVELEVDRDIKAANLQLLVEKVLAIDKQPDRSAYELAIMAVIALARSLKQ